MKSILPRRHALQAGLGLAAALWLPSARACEFFSVNFRLVHPWTRATGDDATSLAVGMQFHDVTRTDRLIGATSPICEGAEMGGDVASTRIDFLIPEGQSTVMSEAGPHLRLVGLKHALPVGREYPLMLEFREAGLVSARLSIDFARFG